MVDIYVLECEDGNVYVGKTTKGEKRLKQHIDGRGAEWTKMHKPKRVMQYYTNATDADERKVTDQMIKKYGAKKVRGAGLTKRKMTKKEIDNLNKKVGFTKSKSSTSTRKKTTTYTCSRCGRQGHNRTQCYAKTNSSGKAISASKKKTTTKKSSAKKAKSTTKKSTAKKTTWKPKAKSTAKKSTRSTSRKTTSKRKTSTRRSGYRRR